MLEVTNPYSRGVVRKLSLQSAADIEGGKP